MDKTPEEIQDQREDLRKLQENKVFQEMQTLLRTRHCSRRREQRLALQKCDSDTGLLIEGILVGIEEAMKIYEDMFKEKKTEKPTVKY